jgi:hypothetical protein
VALRHVVARTDRTPLKGVEKLATGAVAITAPPWPFDSDSSLNRYGPAVFFTNQNGKLWPLPGLAPISQFPILPKARRPHHWLAYCCRLYVDLTSSSAGRGSLPVKVFHAQALRITDYGKLLHINGLPDATGTLHRHMHANRYIGNIYTQLTTKECIWQHIFNYSSK